MIGGRKNPVPPSLPYCQLAATIGKSQYGSRATEKSVINRNPDKGKKNITGKIIILGEERHKSMHMQLKSTQSQSLKPYKLLRTNKTQIKQVSKRSQSLN